MAKKAKRADNTSAGSYFNFAESYWLSASELVKAQVKGAPNRAYPIFFLYYHAIELYLKAYLRANGLTASYLQDQYGHHAGKLSRRALVDQTVSEHAAAQAAQRNDRLTRAGHRPKCERFWTLPTYTKFYGTPKSWMSAYMPLGRMVRRVTEKRGDSEKVLYEARKGG